MRNVHIGQMFTIQLRDELGCFANVSADKHVNVK